MITINIIGAGRVGSHVAMLCALKQLGPIRLYDILGYKAEGHAMDINQMLSSRNMDGNVSGEDIAQFRESDVVVIAVGRRRKVGEKRIDLLDDNQHAVVSSAVLIQKYAPKAIVIVVTNPLDKMVELVQHHTDFPRNRVFGMGSSLDTARFKEIIHQRTKQRRSEIDVFVDGSHDENMTHHADKLSGEDIAKSRDCAIDTISKKGATEFAPAMCVVNIIEAIIENSQECIPVSTWHEKDKKAYSKLEVIGKDGIC